MMLNTFKIRWRCFQELIKKIFSPTSPPGNFSCLQGERLLSSFFLYLPFSGFVYSEVTSVHSLSLDSVLKREDLLTSKLELIRITYMY